MLPSAFANTGIVQLTVAYKYKSVPLGTFIGWASTIYMDSFRYDIGSDSHILLTNIALHASLTPQSTFGVVSQNGNANITKIETNYVRFSAVTQAAKTLNLTFYYQTVPTSVNVGEPSNTTILQASYFTSYASWLAASSPAVYNNVGSSFLMVKSTFATPTIQFNGATVSISSADAPNYLWLLIIPFILIAFVVLKRKR